MAAGYVLRANACTGAPYHIDIYMVGGDLDKRVAGVYHVELEADTLVPVRSEDFRTEGGSFLDPEPDFHCDLKLSNLAIRSQFP